MGGPPCSAGDFGLERLCGLGELWDSGPQIPAFCPAPSHPVRTVADLMVAWRMDRQELSRSHPTPGCGGLCSIVCFIFASSFSDSEASSASVNAELWTAHPQLPHRLSLDCGSPASLTGGAGEALGKDRPGTAGIHRTGASNMWLDLAFYQFCHTLNSVLNSLFILILNNME